MSNGPKTNLLAGAAARLREAGSARLISWVTIGQVARGDEDVNARGVTNFEALQTRVWQKKVPSAVLRDGAVKAKSSRNPLNRLIVTAGVRALQHGSAGEARELFYSEGSCWQATGSDEPWRPVLPEPRRAGYRHRADPTMILEALAAVTDLIDETRTDIDAAPTIQVHARVDLTLIEERLGEALQPRSGERKARQWMRNAPLIACLEQSGRLRRISYAPLPANTTEPFWTTLELFDFGTPLAIPQLAGDHTASSEQPRSAKSSSKS